MAWYSLINFKASLLYSPKVTPEPNDAKRLDEKFAQAKRKRDQDAPPQLRLVAAPRNTASHRK